MATRKSKREPTTLLERIDAFLDDWETRKGKRIDDKTFGWYFGNPRFLETLRGGGEPRRKSLEKAEMFMLETRAEWNVEDRAKAPKRRRK